MLFECSCAARIWVIAKFQQTRSLYLYNKATTVLLLLTMNSWQSIKCIKNFLLEVRNVLDVNVGCIEYHVIIRYVLIEPCNLTLLEMIGWQQGIPLYEKVQQYCMFQFACLWEHWNTSWSFCPERSGVLCWYGKTVMESTLKMLHTAKKCLCYSSVSEYNFYVINSKTCSIFYESLAVFVIASFIHLFVGMYTPWLVQNH